MTIKELARKLNYTYPSGYHVKGRFTGGVITLIVGSVTSKHDEEHNIIIDGIKLKVLQIERTNKNNK